MLTERHLNIFLLKKRLRNPDSQSDTYTDNQQQSGRRGRQTGDGASRDVDEYITGTDIALLRHKVLERRPGQLCSEAENYSNLKSSSFRAILIVFPLPKIPNTQSLHPSWEPILDCYANMCRAGQTANNWIGDEM